MPTKGRGADKVDDFDTRVAKANALKKSSKKRKTQSGAGEVVKEQKVKPVVDRHTGNKKTANFKGYSKLNKGKQVLKKKGVADRLKQKALELAAKKAAEEQDSDDEDGEDDEDDEGDEDKDSDGANEDRASDDEEVEAAGVVVEDDDENEEGEQMLAELEAEEETMESLKAKFQGKKVASTEEVAEDVKNEERLTALVAKRRARDEEHIAKRQEKQAKRRSGKRRKLKGNQATRVGDNYMPFLSTGF